MARCRELLRKEWPEVCFSSLWSCAARDYEDQGRFLNVVAAFETEEAPEAIDAKLRGIEAALGKKTPFRFGPRTIDVDLLLYGDTVMQTDALTVPHPRMHERRFVLAPLSELLDPATRHPALGTAWQELLAKVQDQDCLRLA